MNTPASIDDLRSSRLLTVPNFLSVVRLCFVPVFVWALFGHHDRFLAAAVLTTLGVSDGLDGYIARHFDQVTKFGQLFDPIADRILLITGVVCVAIDGSMPLWIIIAAGSREVVVSMMALVADFLKLPRYPVIWFGKAGTFALMMTVPLFLVAHSSASWHGWANSFGYITGVAAIGFGWIAAVVYFRRWNHAFHANLRRGD